MEENKIRLYKQKRGDKIRWVDTSDKDGEYIFTFDGENFFNMFRDYPYKLTPEQRDLFDKENPVWAEFFSDRTQDI